jgi:hypothetical protein
MMTRRQLLTRVIAGSAAFAGGSSVARAFTEQPMPPAVEAEYLAGCASSNSVGHGDLVRRARALLRGEIASGARPAGAEEFVTCPICGCRMAVTADN